VVTLLADAAGDRLRWYGARTAALAAYIVLSLALLTGMALRTALLSSLARNRAVLAVHSFLSWFWVPLVGVHVVALVLDATARIGIADLVIPFVSAYRGDIGNHNRGVSLGTIGFLVLMLVLFTSLLRRRMSARLWRWIHRLSYPMFVVFLLHAQLVGSDFSRTWVSVLGWATLGSLAMLALPRAAGGRVGA
jgi:sulfoxide reductase heme-binding subunit YedZ